MKAKKILISLVLTMALLLSIVPQSLALSYKNGDKLNNWTLKNVENRNVTSDGKVSYSYFEFDTATNQKQEVYAVEFNPKNSKYLPVVYAKNAGYGSTTIDNAKDAETKYGLNVVAAINASFFSMPSPHNSSNTYGGVTIFDGKIIQGCSDFTADNLVIFQSDGTVDIIQSRVVYNIYFNGVEWFNGGNSALRYINFCPNTADATSTGIYYYDTSCGSNTDVKSKGVEIVCEKVENTELAVGGSLLGKVVEIREVTEGGPVGKDQFVLYAKDGTGLIENFNKVKVGDEFQIDANETIESSKAKMKTASSAFPTYSYTIVKDGENTTASTGFSDSFKKERAQRSGLGIKADGSIVILVGHGRDTDNGVNGMTVFEFADLLISMGCVTAVNLDGGGSTSLVTENSSGALVSDYPTTRRVANSILIVERPSIDSAVIKALDDAIAEAEAEIAEESNAALLDAINAAKAVKASQISTPGDYTKALMNFTTARNGLSELNELVFKAQSIKFGEYSLEALKEIWNAYDYANAVKSAQSASSIVIQTAVDQLKNALALTGGESVNIAAKKPYTLVGLFLTNGVPNYPDTDDAEMTDGVIGNEKYSDAAYIGLNTGAADAVGGVTSITVDLRDVYAVNAFKAYTLTSISVGIKAPKEVKVYGSTNGTDFELLGSGTYDNDKPQEVEEPHINTLQLEESADVRYVKFEFVHETGWCFISEVEVLQGSTFITTADASYLTKINGKIAAGDAVLFTSDVMTDLNGDNANVRWSHTAVCEWDDTVKGYKIIRIKTPNGADDTIEEGQIAVSIHSAEGGEGDPSVNNRAYFASNALVGKYIEFHGVYVDTHVLQPGGYVVIKDAAGFNKAYNGIDNRKILNPGGPDVVDDRETLVPEAEYVVTEGNGFSATYSFEDGVLVVVSPGGWPCVTYNYATPVVAAVKNSKIAIDFEVIGGGNTSILLTAGNQIFKIHQNVGASSSSFDSGSGDLGAGRYTITLDLRDLMAADASADPLFGLKEIEADSNGLITFTSITVYATNGATVKVHQLEILGPNAVIEPETQDETSEESTEEPSTEEPVTEESSTEEESSVVEASSTDESTVEEEPSDFPWVVVIIIAVVVVAAGAGVVVWLRIRKKK